MCRVLCQVEPQRLFVKAGKLDVRYSKQGIGKGPVKVNLSLTPRSTLSPSLDSTHTEHACQEYVFVLFNDLIMYGSKHGPFCLSLPPPHPPSFKPPSLPLQLLL